MRNGTRLGMRWVDSTRSSQYQAHGFQPDSQTLVRRQVLDNLASLAVNPNAVPSIVLPVQTPSESAEQPAVARILSEYQTVAYGANDRHPASTAYQVIPEFYEITDPRNLSAIQIELAHAASRTGDQPQPNNWYQIGGRDEVPADCKHYYGQCGDQYVWVPQQGRQRLSQLVDAVVQHSTVSGELAERFVAENLPRQPQHPTLFAQRESRSNITNSQVNLNPSDAFEQLFNPNLPLLADQERRSLINDNRMAEPRIAHAPKQFAGVGNFQPPSVSHAGNSPDEHRQFEHSVLKRIPVAEKLPAKHSLIRKMSHESESVRVSEKPKATFTRMNGFLIRQ